MAITDQIARSWRICRLTHGEQWIELEGLFSDWELLSNLVFEDCWSCGDLAGVVGFNSVFECDACDDFGEIIKAS